MSLILLAISEIRIFWSSPAAREILMPLRIHDAFDLFPPKSPI